MQNHDRHETQTDSPQHNRRGTEKGRLARLHELDDYRVAEGEPDVRGWTARMPDGRDVGKVENLIVDVGALEVSYLEIALDPEKLRLAQHRNVLVPIGLVWLDDDREIVRLGLVAGELIAAPAYDPRSFSELDHQALQRRYAIGLTRSEEEFAVKTRRRPGTRVQAHVR